jgi:hypothetical protein
MPYSESLLKIAVERAFKVDISRRYPNIPLNSSIRTIFINHEIQEERAKDSLLIYKLIDTLILEDEVL